MNGADAIREAFSALPEVNLNTLYGIKVTHNGLTLNLVACQKALPRGANKGTIHFFELRRGVLLKGLPTCWIFQAYKLSGKDVLSTEGLPKKLSEVESEAFLKLL